MLTSSDGASEEILAALDAFPNIIKKTQALWGTQELDLFLQGLFMDSRGGTRKGFPMEAAEELMFLVKLNKYVRAVALAQQLQISVKETYRIVDKADNAQMQGSAWNDPSSSNEASFRQKHPQKEAVHYQARPVKRHKKSGALAWIVLLILIVVAYKLLYPILKAG